MAGRDQHANASIAGLDSEAPRPPRHAAGPARGTTDASGDKLRRLGLKEAARLPVRAIQCHDDCWVRRMAIQMNPAKTVNPMAQPEARWGRLDLSIRAPRPPATTQPTTAASGPSSNSTPDRSAFARLTNLERRATNAENSAHSRADTGVVDGHDDIARRWIFRLGHRAATDVAARLLALADAGPKRRCKSSATPTNPSKAATSATA
jgi:hypothetical protein